MQTTMKLATMGVLLLAVGAYAQQGESELALRFRGLAPERSEDWDSAAGAELQWRHWGNANAGFALAGGVATWKALRDFVEDDSAAGYYSSLIEGHAQMGSVGASLLARGALGPGVDLVAEGGARYLFVNSDVTARTYSEDRSGARSSSDTLEIDDTWVGLIGLSLEAELSGALSLHGGLEYQFDLGAPHETYLGRDIGETSFSAASVVLGVTMRF